MQTQKRGRLRLDVFSAHSLAAIVCWVGTHKPPGRADHPASGVSEVVAEPA